MNDELDFNQIEAMYEDESTSIPYDDSFEIVPPQIIQEARANPPFLQRTLQTIEEVNEYAYNRGSMGLDTGISFLNSAFNGLNPGLTLVAGPANSGKSALLLDMMRRVIKFNQVVTKDKPKKAYCIYFSLDDTNNELMPRLVASSQELPINEVLFPNNIQDKPEVLAKRDKGFEELRSNAKFFSMYDANNGQSIQKIEEKLELIYNELETIFPGEYQMVIFIDNFHDIEYETESGFMEDNQRFDYISSRLNHIATLYDSPVVCSAEFRKVDSLKRASLSDIKSTGKITYEAKAIILVHNEVGVKGESSDVYWELGSRYEGVVKERKMPVLEMNIAKNKFGSKKGREVLKFIPEFAYFSEFTENERLSIIQKIK